jgi:zinc/manganese transport system substrate-binding protein
MMKLYKHLTVSALLVLLAFPVIGNAKVSVFACEPEWGALAKEIGGDRLKIFSATTAYQDPHHIEARPSLIAKARNADFIFCTGSDLEIGWLPLLLRQSGNTRIQQNEPGYFLASELVDRLEVPEALDRSMGDIHAAGNPHVHLDPYRLLTIAAEFTKRISVIDADNSEHYQRNLEDFSRQWKAAIVVWEAKANLLKGKRVVVHHRGWSYFLAWLGMEEVADLEPKPGLPPTSSHLVSLLSTLQNVKTDFILVAAYVDPKGAKWLSRKSKVPVVTLPYTVGGNANADSLFTLYESTIDHLLAAL